MMKMIAVVVVFIMLVVCPVFAKGVLVDRIVAVVNNTPITAYEVENLAPFFGTSNEKKLLSKVVDDYILKDYAQSVLGIVVPESDVDAYIERVAEKNGITPEQLKEEITSRGYDWKYYREGVRLLLYSQRAIRRMFAGEIFVSKKEVDQYYVTHKSEFELDPLMEVEMIFVQSKAAAERAESALKEGKTFSRIASMYSKAEFRKQVIPLSGFSPSVRGVISSLGPGEVSPIIQTRSGYFIIKLLKKETSISSKAVRNRIKEILVAEKLNQRVEDWLRSMRNSSSVVIIK